MDSTEYCSFVSNSLIICECGENFASEEMLKVHLDRGHDDNMEEIVPAKVVKKEKVVKPIVVYKQDQRHIFLVETTPVKEEDLSPVKEEPHTPHTPMAPNVVFQLSAEPSSPELKQEPEPELVYFEEPGVDYVLDQEQPHTHNLLTALNIKAGAPPPLTPSPRRAKTSRLDTVVERDHDYNCYFCDRCGRGFASEKAVNVHILSMHVRPRPTKAQCQQCGKWHAEGRKCVTARAPAKKRDGNTASAKQTVCDVCGKHYKSHAALKYHQRRHTGEKPYECSYCHKRFTMPLFLQVHVRSHTGERPYECSNCDKAFVSKAALVRHERVHTGEKPYLCPICGKAFSQSNSLKLHVRTVHLKIPAPYKSTNRRLKAAANGKVERPVTAPFKGLLPVTYRRLQRDGFTSVQRLAGALAHAQLTQVEEIDYEDDESEQDDAYYETIIA